MSEQIKEPLYDYHVIPLTEKLHKREYPAISPTRPAVSQAGRTVLVTGGGTGIGYAIVKAFALAGASKIIIVGRSAAKLQGAIGDLHQETAGEVTEFEARECQIPDPKSIDALWDGLAADGIHVDVLVLNAAMMGVGKMWDLEWQWVWNQFEVNVRSHHQFCYRFDQQPAFKGRQVSSIQSPVLETNVLTENLLEIRRQRSNLGHPRLACGKECAQLRLDEEFGNTPPAAACEREGALRLADHQLPPWCHPLSDCEGAGSGRDFAQLGRQQLAGRSGGLVRLV